MTFNLDFHSKFGYKMAQISPILFLRHCHRAISVFFHTTFFSSHQWRGGANNGASAMQYYPFIACSTAGNVKIHTLYEPHNQD